MGINNDMCIKEETTARNKTRAKTQDETQTLQNTGNKTRRETQPRTHKGKTETSQTSRANKGVLMDVQMSPD